MKIIMKARHLLMLLLALTFSLSISAQDAITVTGTVVDDSGEPCIGASVQAKGTTSGVATDIDGNYSISVTPNATLVFSYIGCLPQEVKVAGRNKIDVTLASNSQMLEEVVAIGYGTVKKKDLTGAVSSVSGAELAKAPVTTAAQALQGKAAGVNIVNQSGAPGAGFNVTIRGGTSITQDTEPLYIVDGFTMSNALANIDINDIESIDVLKDASATAIYGARGSNGIIVITTKKAAQGKTRVDYNGYVSFDKLSKKLNVLDNAVNFTKYQFELAELTGVPGVYAFGYDNGMAIDDADFYTGAFDRINENYADSYAVDWQDLTFGGHSTTQNHNVSITTGSEKIQALVSYNYTDQDGLLANHDYKRNSIRAKINAELWKGIKFDFSSFFYENVVHGGGAYSGMKSVLMQPINGGSLFTRDDLIGTQTYPTFNGAMSFYNTSNPIIQNGSTVSEKKNNRFEVNAGVTLDNLVKNFVWRTQYHYNNSWGKSSSFADQNSTDYLMYRDSKGMHGSISNSNGNGWSISNTLTYSNTFAQKHDLTVMLGQEYSASESWSNGMSLIKFPTPNHGLDDISKAEVDTKSTGHSHGNMLSFFARANYSFDDRYLLTATFRADGSSKFAKGNKWGYFPSASAAWRVSQEKFWQESSINDWFNNLKFRAGYGVTGNNGIGSNLYETVAIMTTYPMDNNEFSPAFKVNKLGNENLKWETLHATNIGLDLGMFNNRINLTVEWYNNEISDMLMDCVIPASTGYTTQTQNIGSMRNRGWEISLNTVNIATRDFQWTSVLNLGFNRSKVLGLNNNLKERSFPAGSSRAGTVKYYATVGESLGAMYGFKYDGIYTTADFNDDGTLKDGVVRPKDGTPEIGDIKFGADSYDDNGNPLFTKKEVKIGNGTPDCIGGFGNTFTFKGFDLNVFMNFSIGNDIYNATKQSMQPYSVFQNVPKEFGENYYRLIDPATGQKAASMDILRELNPDENGRIWSLSKTNADNIQFASSYYVEDGSYLRLSQVTLGYTFPSKWMEKAHISKLRLYFTANNLCTITGYDGYDPDVSSQNDKVIVQPGYDSSAYPRSRSYVVGLNLSF